MEMQPSNLFVRQCELYGDTFKLNEPFRCFQYFYSAAMSKRDLVQAAQAGGTLDLPADLWVTPWGHYSSAQARLVLSLPGSPPDRRLYLLLPQDTRLRGPAWVAPLARALALRDPDIGRPGNGLEYQLIDPVSVADYSLQTLT